MHNARSTDANVQPEQTARRRKPDMTGKSLTLRVTLTDTDSEVWRLVRVSAEMTLAELSDALEDVMGWYGDHLHEFRARGVTYWTPPQCGDDIDGYEDDTQYRLGDLLWRRRMKLRWVYDLGGPLAQRPSELQPDWCCAIVTSWCQTPPSGWSGCLQRASFARLTCPVVRVAASVSS